jgi:hexosaminidase
MMMTRSAESHVPVVFFLAALSGSVMISYAASRSVSIIPKPVQMEVLDGDFRLTPATVIVAGKPLAFEGRQLSAILSPATGFALPVLDKAKGRVPVIELKLNRSLAKLGEEGYQLMVTPRKVSIHAPASAGIFYGFQSLRQLLPPQIFRAARVTNVEWTVPCVRIEDYPRFQWRGACLDSARHFMPKEFVMKFIDLLALQKMNSLHWHLTDDQGWRIEIRKYPRLTEVGAWRKETLVGRLPGDRNATLEFDGKPHGGFYTQDDIREIVEYAQVRHVNVVPEIEMPGHAQAALAAYPEYGYSGKPVEVLAKWGVSEELFSVSEKTIGFLQDVLTEVMGLFPSKFIHTGGDETRKAQWKASAEAQARIRELGLKNEEELQAYFTRRMDDFLVSKGRRLIGWDEILEGGLAANAVVMSWRGEKGGIEAARAGHDVVMTPTRYTYFDYYQSRETDKEPLAIGGYIPLEVVYNYEPVPKEIPPEYARHVLGAQGQLWTEYMKTPRQVEYMAFPRLTALAEVTWTPRNGKDYREFLERLSVHLKRLYVLDVNYRPLEIR